MSIIWNRWTKTKGCVALAAFLTLSLMADLPPMPPLPPPPDPDQPYTNNPVPYIPPPPRDYEGKLFLLPPELADNTLTLTITNPVYGMAYDLLYTANLNDPIINDWQLLGHFDPGQVVFIISPFAGSQGFFVIRQSLDSDGDGIPDYLEILNGTDPYSATDLGLKVQITTPAPGACVF